MPGLKFSFLDISVCKNESKCQNTAFLLFNIPKSTSFIFQAISMAVQQDNIQCIQGAYGEPAFEEFDEIFYIIKPNSIF